MSDWEDILFARNIVKIGYWAICFAGSTFLSLPLTSDIMMRKNVWHLTLCCCLYNVVHMICCKWRLRLNISCWFIQKMLKFCQKKKFMSRDTGKDNNDNFTLMYYWKIWTSARLFVYMSHKDFLFCNRNCLLRRWGVKHNLLRKKCSSTKSLILK